MCVRDLSLVESSLYKSLATQKRDGIRRSSEQSYTPHAHTDMDHQISMTLAAEVCYEHTRDRWIASFTSLSFNSKLSLQNISVPQT
jgi:hypothetical protein